MRHFSVALGLKNVYKQRNMDIVSHGLWGGIAFGRRNWKSFWLSFFFGIAPDLFSFGIFTVGVWTGVAHGLDWSSGPPDPRLVPSYVHSLYNVTHSLIIFLLVFGTVWLVRKKPLYELSAWGLHILVDIPTHSNAFFPTPFLWPVSSFHVSGIPWGHPSIFIPNVVLLLVLYSWFFARYRRKRT